MLAAKAFFNTPVAALTPQMEQEFFTSLMAKNKTYKTTFSQRFEDINPFLLTQLRSHGVRTAHILDVGISSGISAVELYDDLHTGGLHAEIVATDILIDAYLVRVLPRCYVLADHDAFPLRFDLPWTTMKPWVTSSDYKTGFFVLRKGVNVFLTRLAKQILRNPDDPRVRRIKLVTPRLVANKNVVVCNDDISRYNASFAGKFDLIRAANVLNRGYFASDALAVMFANIGRYLRRSSGILLVVRTHDDRENHGTLFGLDDGRHLQVMQRFGAGSEVEDVALRVAIPD